LLDDLILRCCSEIHIFFCFQDIATLGVVVVKQCGYTAIVRVPVGTALANVSLTEEDIDIGDQPDGGSNALNVNR
jgi:protein TIF31